VRNSSTKVISTFYILKKNEKRKESFWPLIIKGIGGSICSLQYMPKNRFIFDTVKPMLSN